MREPKDSPATLAAALLALFATIAACVVCARYCHHDDRCWKLCAKHGKAAESGFLSGCKCVEVE